MYSESEKKLIAKIFLKPSLSPTEELMLKMYRIIEDQEKQIRSLMDVENI